jgi:hypothetical protein
VSRRDSIGSLPRIDPAALADHGDSERIDRVWDRLEPNIVFEPKSVEAKRARAWPMVSTAVAAGFAIGVAVSGWLWADRETAAPVVIEPAETQAPVDVYAAGTAPRTFELQGGGILTLEPGSIVDTVSRDGDRLTLRLVRGEATVSAARSQHLALLVGHAEVMPAGQTRVRHDGDKAFLQVLNGSAAVNAPDAEPGAQSLLLGPAQEATVPVRVVTASLDPHVAPATPADDAVPNATEPIPEESSDEPAAPAVVAEPAWIAACREGDDKRAAEIFAQEGSSLATIGDASLKLCVSAGQEMLGDPEGAVATLEAVIAAHEATDPDRAMFAASDLARLYAKLGKPDKAAHYQRKRAELSKGKLLLTERALCKKIEREAAADNGDVVLELGALYVSQFPNGPCTDTVNKLLAAHASEEVDDDERDAPKDDAPKDGEPDPYEAPDGKE